MLIKEIIRTCSNAQIANAALACIGGEFAENFAAEAARKNLSPGLLASLMVQAFSESASGDHWAELSSAARGSDHPILSGLQHILSRSVISSEAK